MPHAAPGHAAASYYLVAAAAAVAFYACLLAHELAHALVARRHGIAVDGIVLWLLGGVSRLRGEPADPGTELAVSAAGPASSMGLALVFFALSRLAGGTGLAAAALGWLGWINGGLAAFNLIPAFPLDGGRVLRSVVWHRRGDKGAATSFAARLGQVFGYGFIGVGVVGALATTAGLSGVWLALIGWFLVSASAHEARSSARGDELAGLRVADAMDPDPVTVPAWATLDRVWDECVWKRRLAVFPIVVAGGAFVGVASAARARAVPPERWATVTAGAIMVPAGRCVTAGPDEELAAVARRLSSAPDGLAVVLWSGRVIGTVTDLDVERAVHAARLRRAPTVAV
ncbi:MAG TPA: site-2 protease family protein [Acidimicrobiales bacterium]|nr:site-2 protease family protein [Acidimicrobiales bacterium]